MEEGEEDEEGDEPQMMEQPVPDGPHEAEEGEDSVGLLGVGTRSPKSSMVSSRRRRSHRSDSGRSHSDSRSGSHLIKIPYRFSRAFSDAVTHPEHRSCLAIVVGSSAVNTLSCEFVYGSS